MRLDRGSLRNDFRLESEEDSANDKTKFSAFMRINESFPENFSIGLMVYPKDQSGSFCLLRYNGPHGDHVNDLLDPHPHVGFHIHEARAESIESGFSPERFAELTDDFGSYEEALIHFLKRTNVINIDQYFDIRQLPLFPGTGGEK